MILTLVKIECEKIFRKWRTYIGFIAIGVLTPIVQFALFYEGDQYFKMITSSLQDSFMFVGNFINGYAIANVILQMLFVHIPFLIVLVGGDLLASEATSGTYRMLITRPVSRSQILLSKYIAGSIYTLLLLLWLMIISLFVSILFFGTGELLILKDKIYIFAENDIMWRFLLAYGFSTLSMLTVLGLSFLFSSLVENAIGPIVGSMAVIIVFLILSTLPIEFFKPLKPYLFTNHMAGWQHFFGDPVDYIKVLKSASVLLLHIFGFYLVTQLIFCRKDILT